MKTIKELKFKAIHVEDGMETCFPQFSKREGLKVSELKATPKTFAYNNSVVAFVDEDGWFFVIPNFKGVQKLLIENGYKKAYFYVPFSNWDYPVIGKTYWEKLWEEKNKEK